MRALAQHRREKSDAAQPLAGRAGARTTSATPTAVRPTPSTVPRVIGSPNSTQAISAVVGGTRYIRLATEAAAPRWISR